MSDEANRHKLAGNNYFNENKFPAAIKEYLKGLEFNSKSADLHSNLSAAYFCMENYHEAKEHGLFAIFLKPEWYRSYTRVAKALQGQGEAGSAVKYLEEGLQHVNDAVGKREIKKLIDELKRDPCYTVVKAGVSKKSKDPKGHVNGDVQDSDSDSDIIEEVEAKLSQIGKKTSAIPLPPPTTLPSIEDNKSKKEVSENEKVNVVTSKEQEKPAGEDFNFLNALLELKEEAENKDGKSIKTSKDHKDGASLEDNVSLVHRDFLGVLPSLDRPTLPKELQTWLSSGFQAAQKHNYHKACESYRAARDFALTNDNEVTVFETHVIHYALNFVSIELGTYDELVQAMHNFTDMASEYDCCKPGAEYHCARVYYKLNRFKEAQVPLESCLEMSAYHCFMKHIWPGSKNGEYFEETTRSGLKKLGENLQQMCRIPPAVTAVCKYPSCLTLSTHIAPSTHIYLSDPDFIGYVSITCQEKCRIEFHIGCWKSLRDNEISKVSKISDKDMLGRPCMTEDCISYNGVRSVIISISIIGQDGSVKTNMKYEPVTNKSQNNEQSVSKKSKKKRSKSTDEKSSSVKVSKVKTSNKKKEVPAAVVASKPDNAIPSVTNLKKSLQDRITFLESLRETNFGVWTNWDPQCIYYGNEAEHIKKETNCFLDTTREENSDGVNEAKEFLFSFFHSILEKEGLLKMSEIEEKWESGANDLMDIKTVLPNMTSICDVLLESTRFCSLDENICLSDQLPETYNEAKIELSESVDFILSGTCETTNLENGLDHIQDVKAPTKKQTQVTQEHATSEEPVSDSVSNVFEADFNNLQDVYFSDESEDSEEESSWSDVEDSSHDLEEEEEEDQELDTTIKVDGDIYTIGDVSFSSKPLTIYDIIEQNSDFDFNNLPRHHFNGKEESVQTEPKPETCDTECQTEDTEVKLNNDLNDKVKSLQQDIDNLKNNLASKQKEIEKLEKLHDKKIQKLEGEKSKLLEKHEKHIKQLQDEFSKKEEAYKTEKLSQQAKNKELRLNYKEMFKQMEEFKGVMRTAVGENMVKKHRAVLADLNSRKCFCELQIKNFTSRCVEKMTEYQNLVSNLWSEELKDLPCWDLIKQNIQIWEDAIVQVNRTEASFQELYNKLNDNLARGEDVEDMSVLKLGPLPEVPPPIQIDKLFRNILKKYEVKINQLQQVIANSQIALVNQQSPFYSHSPLLGPPVFMPPPLYRVLPPDTHNIHQGLPMPIASKPDNAFNNLYKPPSLDLEQKSDSASTSNISALKKAQPSLVGAEIPQAVSNTPPSPVHSDKSLRFGSTEFIEGLTLSPHEPSLPIIIPPKPVPNLEDIPSNNSECVKKKNKGKQKSTNVTNDSKKSTSVTNDSKKSTSVTNDSKKSTSVTNDSKKSTSVTNDSKKSTSVANDSKKSTSVTNDTVKEPPVQSKRTKPQLVLDKELFDRPAEKTSEKKKKGKRAKEPIVDKRLHTTLPPGLPLELVRRPFYIESSTAHVNRDLDLGGACAIKDSDRDTEYVAAHVSQDWDFGGACAIKDSDRDMQYGAAHVSRDWDLGGACATKDEESKDDESLDKDSEGWEPVRTKRSSSSISEPAETLSNKAKLMDKLATEFPNFSKKELEEILMTVRKENGNTLSGLPFAEIGARIEKVMILAALKRSTTMGLEKFLDSAWNEVKETDYDWTNIAPDECTICLEPMRGDKTTLDCNHVFDTNCIRKWLQERSVCPLCNKYSTMVDEFPYLPA